MSKSLLSSRSTILIFSVASSIFESVMYRKAFGRLVSFKTERFGGGASITHGAFTRERRLVQTNAKKNATVSSDHLKRL